MKDISDDLGIDDVVVTSADAVPSPAPEPGPGRREGRLDPETRRRIGRSLRVLYAGLLAQPIPERFEALVAEFAARSEEESAR